MIYKIPYSFKLILNYILEFKPGNAKVTSYLNFSYADVSSLDQFLVFKITAICSVTFIGMVELTKTGRTKIRGALQFCLKLNLKLMKWNVENIRFRERESRMTAWAGELALMGVGCLSEKGKQSWDGGQWWCTAVWMYSMPLNGILNSGCGKCYICFTTI